MQMVQRSRIWRNRWRLLALSVLMGLLTVAVAACRGPQTGVPPPNPTAAEHCRTINHDVGSTRVCGQPQRIAVLAPHMLDILLSLGLQPAGYAEFTTSGIGEPTRHIPVLGPFVTSTPINLGLRNTPSLET